MAFIDHIAACNRHDLSRFRPFRVAGQTAGWIREDFLGRLTGRPDLFMLQPHAVTLNPTLETPQARSEALERFLLELRDDGTIKGWRGERYAVARRFGETPLLEIERAAVPFFGIRAYGVHLVGYVRRPDGLHIWVGRRSRLKPTYPGMLDNTVAGGQPAGLGLMENLVKECEEEASMPAALARTARPVGVVTYCMEQAEGLKPDVLYNFELELPDGFVPENRDGEIESFELWPAEKVIARVRDTFEFKFNCNLVLIDFFVRHGLIGPDEPDYVSLVTGLHSHPDGPRAT